MELNESFRILGVSPDADLKEIWKAYLKTTQSYEDNQTTPKSEKIEQLKLVNEAYTQALQAKMSGTRGRGYKKRRNKLIRNPFRFPGGFNSQA